MQDELTEAEMRQALFGEAPFPPPTNAPPPAPCLPPATARPAEVSPRGKTAKSTPRFRVTLRVGNDFEGETHDIRYEADTLSTLLVEQQAVKTARKKFRYIEVISVKPL